jgi:hypothetical protein
MHSSPSIVPDQDDRDIYLVLDDFGGRLGRAWPETDEERTDREIRHHGPNDGPVFESRSRGRLQHNMSEEIADELMRWYAPTGQRDPAESGRLHRATR